MLNSQNYAVATALIKGCTRCALCYITGDCPKAVFSRFTYRVTDLKHTFCVYTDTDTFHSLRKGDCVCLCFVRGSDFAAVYGRVTALNDNSTAEIVAYDMCTDG